MKAFVLVLLLSAIGTLQAMEGTPLTLNCKFEMEKHYWGEQYTCIGQNVDISRYDTYIQQVTGDHLPGKSIKDVKTFHIDNARSRFIPFNLNTTFPSLVALRIESSGLRHLNVTTFRALPLLTHIHLVDNELESIPKKTFHNLQALTYLSLSSNQIREIDSDLLTGNRNLRFFFIADNKLEVVGSSLFRNNAKLEEIIFDNNQIRRIGTKLVVPISDLKLARFDSNICTNIDLRYVPNITFQLSSEFGQRCNIVCPTTNGSDPVLQNAIRQNLLLKSQTMANRAEKQTLRYNCQQRPNTIERY